MASAILLAEGDEVLSAAYESFLIAEGYRVATARTGVECLEALRRDPPRLLVLDPGLLWGGMGVLALIAEHDDLPAVPVLILTEQPEEILSGLVPPGPSAVVLKPFAPAALAAMVRSLEPIADMVMTIRQTSPQASPPTRAPVGVIDGVTGAGYAIRPGATRPQRR